MKSPRSKEEVQLTPGDDDNDDGGGNGLEAVLAWHALPGYWLGLANEEENSNYGGPASTLHYPHFSTDIIENDLSLLKEKSILKGIGIAKDPRTFYDEYHSFLQSCGFDGVKVDAQGVSGYLRPHQSRHDYDDHQVLGYQTCFIDQSAISTLNITISMLQIDIHCIKLLCHLLVGRGVFL